MADELKPSRSLSEIGHLFLSSVRERQTNGAPMPRRQPPQPAPQPAPTPRAEQTPPPPAPPKSDVSVDLTPEEVAHVSDPASAAAKPADALHDSPARLPAVSAIIAAPNNGNHLDAARAYARHLAATGLRIGLMEVDASSFRVSCFEATQDGAADALPTEPPACPADPRDLADAIEELSWDLDRWLLVLPNPRSCEARCLLRDVQHWVLLSTADHDGVVACYRTLKGLHESRRPRLSLAVLNARDAEEADRTYRKLASVCHQFLNWELEVEPPVEPTADVAEHAALATESSRTTIGPQWQVVADLLARAKNVPTPAAPAVKQHPSSFTRIDLDEVPVKQDVTYDTADDTADETGDSMVAPIETHTPSSDDSAHDAAPAGPRLVADVVVPRVGGSSAAATTVIPPRPKAPVMQRVADVEESSTVDEVVDLPEGHSTSAGILAAVLRARAGELIECPLPVPACPEARLAVTRDRRLVLLAVTEQGLAELRGVGRAYQWLNENRALIAMALPQFAIDAAAMPRLRLLVDHADLSADILQPMLQSGAVSVVAYRKLRWGNKTGLLLEAA